MVNQILGTPLIIPLILWPLNNFNHGSVTEASSILACPSVALLGGGGGGVN